MPFITSSVNFHKQILAVFWMMISKEKNIPEQQATTRREAPASPGAKLLEEQLRL